MIDLPLILAGVIVFAIVMYVLLDGFDLGIGLLFPFVPDEADRDTLIGSIAPVWDGNETWLVLGGAVLFAAFPTAYAVVLPAFYLPLTVMLLALVFRGVAFEFRMKATRSKALWNAAFFGGSLVATLMQGLILGAFINGIEVDGPRFAGGPFDWLTPFSVLTAVMLVAGYGLLGAAWAIWKTDGALQRQARRLAAGLMLAVMGALALTSLQTPLTHPEIAERWFGGLNLLWLSPIPLLTAFAGWRLWRSIRGEGEAGPYLWSAALFLLGFLGLAVSLWPYAIPRAFTGWEAAAPASSLTFTLVAIAFTLPLVLGYTWYAYRVFRGKVSPGAGYAAIGEPDETR